MDYAESKRRLDAAYALISAPSTSKAKIEALIKLLKGINPVLDQKLGQVVKELTHLEKIQQGEVIELIADGLPENTEEDKRRKKALLWFLKFWGQLKNEVKRVQAEFAGQTGETTLKKSASSWSKIFYAAKGPLGLITVLAIGLVYLQSKSVSITIQNQGCRSVNPVVSVPVRLPGLSFPDKPITDGASATVVMPPLNLTVIEETGALKLRTLGFTLQFNLASGTDIVFDETSLLGRQTSVRLGERDTHTLEIRCS